MFTSMRFVVLLVAFVFVATGCSTSGKKLARKGDEIVIAGQYFHTGAPVVLWTDPGGYDAYRTERRFSKWEEASYEITKEKVKDISSPARYNLRRNLTPAEIEKARGGGWDLELAQEKIDQFVIHYDVCGTSRQCFKVLHDMRGLSVHFMLDIDGTIYQTLDVKERAWHAGTANTRSVGIEIANMGAYTANQFKPLQEWYSKDENGKTFITIPARLGDGGVRNPGTYRPIRNEMVQGEVQGETRYQYDLTPQQYDSLIKLTAALGTVLPRITVDYPKDENGQLITKMIPLEEQEKYTGLIGHFHVTSAKQDPGPAFQWDKVVKGARARMTPWALKRNEAFRGKAAPTTAPSTAPSPNVATLPQGYEAEELLESDQQVAAEGR